MNSLFALESQDQFRNATEEILNSLYSSKSSTSLESNITTLAKEELKQIISSNDFDLTKVRNDLLDKQWNRDRIDWFTSLLEEKSTELLYNSLLHHNTLFGEAIVNFDWRLKIVLGTSELKTLTYPLLQLFLTTNSTTDQRQKLYEMNKEMLKKFIDTLEKL